MRLWRDEVGVAGPRGMGMPNSMMQQQMAQMSSMMMPMMMATALGCVDRGMVAGQGSGGMGNMDEVHGRGR